MLDDCDDFMRFLGNYKDKLFVPPSGGTHAGPDVDNYRLHCPKCGGLQLMDVHPYWWAGAKIRIKSDPSGTLYWRVLSSAPEGGQLPMDLAIPSLYSVCCRNCHTEFTLILYPGPDGTQLAVFPTCHGGLSTPHTPDAVRYYLDQAYRARSVGAFSAAMAMFRSALEHLLHDQDYTARMLGPKLGHLTKDIKARKAPDWAMNLETDFLEVMNKLANAAIHPGEEASEKPKLKPVPDPDEGRTEKLAQIDGALVSQVQTVFSYLLFLVYEQPHQKKAALADLTRKADLLKR